MSHASDVPLDWGRAAIAEVLDTAPHHIHDIAWGDGSSYLVGHESEQPTRLDLYPAAGVARLTTGDAQITLFRQSSPSLYTDHLRFEHQGADERQQLILTRQGRLRLDVAPSVDDASFLDHRPSPSVGDEPLQNIQNDPHGADDGIEILPAIETPVTGHSRGQSVVAEDPSGKTERERVTLSGRLGQAPSFRTTRTGKLIATFPVAVRDEAGATTWHTVLAFDARAEKLRNGFAKGQAVDIIGYRHQREKQTKAGDTRLVEEIYATVITLR